MEAEICRTRNRSATAKRSRCSSMKRHDRRRVGSSSKAKCALAAFRISPVARITVWLVAAARDAGLLLYLGGNGTDVLLLAPPLVTI
ncbi:hypothetical protein [Dactylosporangium sp. CA-092794]|uniref:hypothetical protein n=1 Tax=Dactylosporangium sp. CA-092794 TaxID=3239929 RepID=UPI003D934E70